MPVPSHINQIECDEIDLGEACGEARVSGFVAQKLVPQIPHNATIVTLDGFDGVGKSTIAKHMSNSLGLPLLGLDDFLAEGQDRYLDAFNFDALAKNVDGSLLHSKALIVEGCMLEAAIERIGKHIDFRIYVMRTTRMRSGAGGEWIDEFDLLYGETATDELIADKENQAKRWTMMPKEFGGGGNGNMPNLERELIRYHRDYRPHDQADIILKRVHWS